MRVIRHGGKANVLIELGYAKRALGPERVVLVWNTAATGARPEDMPFDMRHRRAPLAYALAEGAERQALRLARADLSRRLEEAVRSALGAVPAAEPERPAWTEAEPGEAGL